MSRQDSLVLVEAINSQAAIVGPQLADAPDFVANMTPLQASPAIAVYVDAKVILDRVNQIADRIKKAGAQWPKVRDALGISDLKTFTMTAGFDGQRWATASLLKAPGPRKGLLAVMEPKALDPAFLARIPATADSVCVHNFDAALFFDTIAAVMSFDPQSDKIFHQATGLASIALGRNLRRQILAPLGSQWVTYTSRDSHGLVVMNHPNDADGASDSLVSAAFGIINLANSQLSGPDRSSVVDIDQKTVRGVDITSAVTKVAAPTFAVKNKVLYVGLSPDAVVAAANIPDVSAGRDILHSDVFKSAMNGLAPGDGGSFFYSDVSSTAADAYEKFPEEQKQLQKTLKQFDIDLPAIEFPSLGEIKPHLSPIVSVTWADAEGIHSRSVTPFPGCALLMGDSQEMLAATTTASAIGSIARPAIMAERERVRRTQCASNERQLGVAMMLYSKDNHDQLPPDLGTLITSQDLSATLVLCPSALTKLPPNFDAMLKADKANWINDNSDYVYIGKGLNLSDATASRQLIMFEKDAAHGGSGMNLLFSDGSTEFRSAADAKKIIQDQRGGM